MPNNSVSQMQLYHQTSDHLHHEQTSSPIQQITSPTAGSIASAFNLSNFSMTSGTVNSLINNSSLISTNGLTSNTMTTTSQTTNVNSVINAQLNALGLSGLTNLNGLNNLTSLANLANLENTGDYQNTLLNQLNQNSNLLNRTNGTSLDSLISNADSLSPSANSAHSITTIANSTNHLKVKNAQLNKLNQQQLMAAALAASNNGQASPNLISDLLNYYDLRKLYENMPLNSLYPALFGSSPLLRDQHALAYKQTLQVETPLDLSMSVKDESMDCDQTEDDLEEQKLLMNTSNYETLLSNEQLLNLNAKQVNLLKTLANNQQLNLMKKENLESNKLIKLDDELKKSNDRYSPLSNKQEHDKQQRLNLEQFNNIQASQKVILQHLQSKQMNKCESDQNSAPQSPSSVHSIKSDHSTKGTNNKFNNKLSTSPRLNGVHQEKQINRTNESNTIDNHSPISSPISSPLLNNVNGLFNNIDSSSLNQHLLNNQTNNNSRTSSPTLNSDLDSQLLNKLTVFQQLLNQQQQNSPSSNAQSTNHNLNNINSLISNLINLNRNGTTQTANNSQLNSMSTLNLLNNLINGNQNLSNNQTSLSPNQSLNSPSSTSTTPNQQSRNQLLNTLQKLNSLTNHNNQNSNSSFKDFKDSNVNINNSNNSANSVSTVNSSSNGSKFNDSISNGPLNSPNNLQVAWPTNGQPPTSNSLVTLANNINSSLSYAQANGAATGQQLTLNGNVKLTLDAHCDTLAALQTAAAVVNAKKVVIMDDSNPLCDKSTIIKKSRVRTMLPCEYCGKAFDRPSLLRRHLRTHTGEKPHVCTECGKGFSTSSSLNTHKRIHTGEKPHCCPVCNKKFTASSNLYYHRMTHQREKPHKCTFKDCHKSFPTPGDLKSHSYSHNGCWPFQCPVCNRGFSKINNLKHHMQQHDVGNKADKHDKNRMMTQG